MALMTGDQYIESIRALNMQVYMFGKKIENPVDDPILRPSLNSVRATYDLAQMPEHQDLMTAISPYTGQRVNRFTHIHQSTEDLIKKVKMQRLLGQKTATPSSPLLMRSIRSMAPPTTKTSESLCCTVRIRI